MRSILWTALVLATAALAAPSYSPVPGDSDAISTYFQRSALKVEERRDIVCDLAKAQMPQSSKPA
jgi:hypothetical protein